MRSQQEKKNQILKDNHVSESRHLNGKSQSLDGEFPERYLKFRRQHDVQMNNSVSKPYSKQS
jgi:hypothetical protein